jgi:hypothetical protein
MSIREAMIYFSGDTLKNDTHHTGRTNSVGFCFFPLEQDEPETAFRYMAGITNMDVCIVFEVNDKTLAKMKKGYGIYSSYKEGAKWGDTQTLTEYSIKEYNIKDFKPVKACFGCAGYYYNNRKWRWEENETQENTSN